MKTNISLQEARDIAIRIGREAEQRLIDERKAEAEFIMSFLECPLVAIALYWQYKRRGQPGGSYSPTRYRTRQGF